MRFRCVVLASILLLSAVPAAAQRTSAILRGTVTDASKALVPGATVTVTNAETGLTQSSVTNEAGIYTFSQLPVGRYQLKVELQGFKTATRTDIVLAVADQREVDIELAPGALSETVSVV